MLSEERAARSPAAEALSPAKLRAVRADAAVSRAAGATPTSITPISRETSPRTMLIDEMEAIWAPIAERDDWWPVPRRAHRDRGDARRPMPARARAVAGSGGAQPRARRTPRDPARRFGQSLRHSAMAGASPPVRAAPQWLAGGPPQRRVNRRHSGHRCVAGQRCRSAPALGLALERRARRLRG